MSKEDKKDEIGTNITTAMGDCFHALTSGKYDNFALLSCFVDGEPSAAIVQIVDAIDENDKPVACVYPLFVAITSGMAITDHEGHEPDFGEEINMRAMPLKKESLRDLKYTQIGDDLYRVEIPDLDGPLRSIGGRVHIEELTREQLNGQLQGGNRYEPDPR